MFIHRCLLFVALMTSWLLRTHCLLNPSYDLMSGQRTNSCPSDGVPVCGLQDKQLVLFPNDCLFDAINEGIPLGKTIFTKTPLQYCMQGCEFSCPVTYKPVCTRNRITLRKHLFRNQCELSKIICKRNMDYIKINLYECLPRVDPRSINRTLAKRDDSSKRRRRPVPCTNVFRPVCGSYLGVKSSFKNECILNAENVAFNRDWRIIKYGMCPEDFSKTRRRKDNPANLHALRKRSYKNIFLNQYSPGFQLDANVANKNELNASPNDMYVYLPSTYQDELLSQHSSNYHRPLTDNEVYEEYLKRIGVFTPFDMPFTQPEETINETDDLNFKETIVRPAPFSVNGVNANYVANKNLAYEINQQASLPGTEHIEPIISDTPIESTSIKNEYLNAPVETAKKLETTSGNTLSQENISKQKQIKREKTADPNNDCKYGSVQICAALTDGTLRTFETICEMMAANVYLEKTWAKLHEGSCENCKYNCSRDYEPVCVSRNGVNYTMVNECYYNMGICMDKKSKWQLLSKKQCDRYTRIPDKYSNSKPGFRYTSSYFVSSTTEMTKIDSISHATPNKLLTAKSSKDRKHKASTKRAVSRGPGTERCCSRSRLSNLLPEDVLKCECWTDTTEEPLSSDEFQTESHVMNLVREKGSI